MLPLFRLSVRSSEEAILFFTYEGSASVMFLGFQLLSHGFIGIYGFYGYLPKYGSHITKISTFFFSNKNIYNFCLETLSRRTMYKKVIRAKP